MALDLQTPDPGEEEDNEVVGNEREDNNSVESEGNDEPVQSGGADETDELDEEEAQDEIDAQPEKPVSRGERRFQALSNEIKEERDRRATLERELNELKQRAQTPAQREPTQDEMALWTEDQRVDYRMKQRLDPVMEQMNQMRRDQIQTTDKATFSAICATDARANRLKGEVEQLFASEWQAGRYVPREVLFELLLGRKIRQGGTVAKERAQKDGQRRIARQTASPGNAKGDQEAKRGKLSPAEERLKRLENITF